jgi:hypothetical protein
VTGWLLVDVDSDSTTGKSLEMFIEKDLFQASPEMGNDA